MKKFDDGVKRFIKAKATVEVNFPVSWKDSIDVCCEQCPFYNRNYICQLNKKITAYPKDHIGHFCPLIFEDEEEN